MNIELFEHAVERLPQHHTPKHAPCKPIERHEVAALICCTFSLPTSNPYEALEDVAATHPHFSAIHYLHIANVVSSPCRKFYPNSTISYVECMNLLHQIVKVLKGPACADRFQLPNVANCKKNISYSQFIDLLSITKNFLLDNRQFTTSRQNAI